MNRSLWMLTYLTRLCDRATLALGQGQTRAAADTLRESVALYKGSLFPACYEEWIEPERAQLDTRFANALAQLSTIAENQRAYPDAIKYARRLLQYDPLYEAHYRRLMRLHTLGQDRAGTLRVYQECVETFRARVECNARC